MAKEIEGHRASAETRSNALGRVSCALLHAHCSAHFSPATESCYGLANVLPHLLAQLTVVTQLAVFSTSCIGEHILYYHLQTRIP